MLPLTKEQYLKVAEYIDDMLPIGTYEYGENVISKRDIQSCKEKILWMSELHNIVRIK